MKIGLIGCGKWGRNILRDLVSLNIDVIVYEVDEKKKEAAFKQGAKKFKTGLEELGNLDGLIICTPATTHAELLNKLKEFDKPVFVEKPLCTNINDLEFIKKHSDKDIFLMHIWRYHAGIVGLGEINRSRELGNLVQLKTIRANWTSPRVDTDSVWTLVPHDLTIAYEILGYIPEPIFATCEIYGGQPKGMLGILGKSPKFIFEVSNRYFDKRREIRAHFENGVAVIKDEKVDYIEIYHGNEKTRAEDVKVEKRFFDNSLPLKKELSSFIQCLNGGNRPKSDLQEGIKVVENILKLRKLAGLSD